MGDLAHLHVNRGAVDDDLRHVLLLGTIGVVGTQLNHLLAAAGHGHALVERLDSHVAAMHALEEFDVHGKPLSGFNGNPHGAVALSIENALQARRARG